MTTLYYIALALIMFSVGFILGTARMREKIIKLNAEWLRLNAEWQELCEEREKTIDKLTKSQKKK